MRRWAWLAAVSFGCSGGSVDSLDGTPHVQAPGSIVPTGPSDAGGFSADAAVRRTDAGAAIDAKPASPPTSSGGTGGAGPGEHDVVVAGSNVALHVPSGGTQAMRLLILLHGQGDTGRNFLNVWLAKGLPSDVLIAAPDENTDAFTVTLESSLRSLYDVDTKREYVFGFSQGGGYAAFLLFDPSAGNRFAAIGLGSSGLAENPAAIPPAGAASPAIAVVIDPTDPNNTWNQGLHVMEDFVGSMTSRGYDAKLWTHGGGHRLEPAATQAAITWMFNHEKP